MAEAASPSSHSSFCEEVFSVVAACLWYGSGTAHSAVATGPNEVDRTNILAPGLFRQRRNHLLPAFTPEIFEDWPNGKSYPVTAAQLLPILTGFLAPIHFSKLAKNWIEK